MLRELAATTNVIAWMMAGIGVLGVLAKIINQVTLRRLLKASSNMTKSTHRLIKLVRAKYEHACMIHDSVDNIEAFVEKYIYEYRGFLFRIHTWSQVGALSVWFVGMLAVIGAAAHYLNSGFTESVYQYIAGGSAEVVLLLAAGRIADETYKIQGIKMYMVDYLDNICAFRLRKQRGSDRESIDVIASDGVSRSAFQRARQSIAGNGGEEGGLSRAGRERGAGDRTGRESTAADVRVSPRDEDYGENRFVDVRYADESYGEEAYAGRQQSGAGIREVIRDGMEDGVRDGTGTGIRTGARGRTGAGEERVQTAKKGFFRRNVQRTDSELPINIEGEPEKVVSDEALRNAVRQASAEVSGEEKPALREEAIRQILEEFLA